MNPVDNALSRLKSALTTAAAIIIGVVNVASRRIESSVELRPGDPAPDFTLEASDGRTYRLRDVAAQRAVVIAWFPKAFTGG
jgi:peroxiredoxin Q/BCP